MKLNSMLKFLLLFLIFFTNTFAQYKPVVSGYFHKLSQKIENIDLSSNHVNILRLLEQISSSTLFEFQQQNKIDADKYFASNQFANDYLANLFDNNIEILTFILEYKANIGLNLDIGLIKLNNDLIDKFILTLNQKKLNVLLNRILNNSFENKHSGLLNIYFNKWNPDSIKISDNPIDIKLGEFKAKGFSYNEYSLERFGKYQIEYAKYASSKIKLNIKWLSSYEFELSISEPNVEKNKNAQTFICRITEISDSSYTCLTKYGGSVKLNELIKIK